MEDLALQEAVALRGVHLDFGALRIVGVFLGTIEDLLPNSCEDLAGTEDLPEEPGQVDAGLGEQLLL